MAAGFQGEAEIFEKGMAFFIGKGKMADTEGQVILLSLLFRQGHFLLFHKFPDPVDAGHGGLDIFYFHAQAFQRGEDFSHIGDEGSGGAGGHAEKGGSLRTHGENGHEGYEKGAGGEDDGRVNRIVEVCLFHGLKTFLDGGGVSFLHEIFTGKKTDGADIAAGFGNQLIGGGNGLPVFYLGSQHVMLEGPGEKEEKGKGCQEQQE